MAADGRSGRRSRAFAPAHVTGAFAPRTEARDPRARGSVGVGIVLGVGVLAEARWTPALRAGVTVVADVRTPLGISTEVARRLLERRTGRLTVHLRHELPIGQGFGMSAAGATAVALAVGRVVGVGRRTALETAHLAELFGRGGLGGVASILGGGIERRTRPGIPPWGEVEHRRLRGSLWLGIVGRPIASPSVLGRRGLMERIGAAYGALRFGPGAPTISELWSASERFTDRVALAPRAVRDALRGVRRRGGRAAQAMFGASFFAELPDGQRGAEVRAWLRRSGVRVLEVPIAEVGARLRPTARAGD